MSNLPRTQIYIEKGQMNGIKLEAKKRQIAVSELIRRAIKRFLASKTSSANWNKDPITKAIGKIKLSVTHASTDHNRYLYS